MNEIVRPFADPTPESVRSFVESVPMYAADDDPTFWSAERLGDRRDELLRRQLGWHAEASPYYRKLFADNGIDVETIKGTDDLVQLPVTTKLDLMKDPSAFRLRFEHPTVYDTTYNMYYTTGTTLGRPTPYEYTTHDYFGALQSYMRADKINYWIPGDLAVVAFPLSPIPHIGSPSSFAMFAAAAGVGFVSGMTGTPYDEFPIHRPAAHLIDTIERARPQVLLGIASYLRRMLMEAADAGRDFSSVRVVVAGAEACTAQMREHMRANLARLGAPDVYISGTYGFTEGAVPCAPCVEGGGLHNAGPDQIFFEVLDEASHERVPDGQTGVLAVTHLNRRGMPLLRYLLGDVTVISNAGCTHCGRNTQTLLVSSGTANVRRTSDLIKVKGTLMNPHLVHDVAMNTPGVVEYQLIVTNELEGDPLSDEKLLLRVGLAEGEDSAQWQRGAERSAELRKRIFSAIEIRPEVVVVDRLDDIYDPTNEFKARRVVDRRVVG